MALEARQTYSGLEKGSSCLELSSTNRLDFSPALSVGAAGWYVNRNSRLPVGVVARRRNNTPQGAVFSSASRSLWGNPARPSRGCATSRPDSRLFPRPRIPRHISHVGVAHFCQRLSSRCTPATSEKRGSSATHSMPRTMAVAHSCAWVLCLFSPRGLQNGTRGVGFSRFVVGGGPTVLPWAAPAMTC